jgi:hypothetical protein
VESGRAFLSLYYPSVGGEKILIWKRVDREKQIMPYLYHLPGFSGSLDFSCFLHIAARECFDVTG